MPSAVKTILLVEDEPIIALSESKTLTRFGYSVITAYTGLEAVDIADSGRTIDLILMDIDLGKGMDGTEAASIILSRHEVPVVFLSSHIEPEIVEKTDAITSYGYIVKNSGDTVLAASIKMAFRLHNAYLDVKKSEKELSDTKTMLQSAFEQTPNPMALISMPDRIIRVTNPALREFLGIKDESPNIGKPFYGLKPTWQDFDRYGNPLSLSEVPLALALRGIVTKNTEYITRRKDGSMRWQLVNSAPIKNEAGEIIAAYLVFSDITDRKQMEEILRREITDKKLAETALEKALAEKEALLRELQHRVKNSFAIVAGIVGLEADRVKDPPVRHVLEDIRSRILSLTNLYELLQHTEEVKEIRLDFYIDRMSNSLISTYTSSPGRITLVQDLDEILIDVKRALSIGLIINELLTNALKYAFPRERSGTIRLVMKKGNDKITIELMDNGDGLPCDFDIMNPKGLGLQLVRMLTSQLDGAVDYETGPVTVFRITFPAGTA